MENFIRRRVAERLSALGINAFEAARRAKTDRAMVNDLLIGKKESIRRAALIRVAQALECDPEYLIGAQATPRRGAGEGQMPLAGTIEAGVWRARQTDAAPTMMPVVPDPRYPPERQAAYLVRGTQAEPLGLKDGDVLITVADEPPRDGDIVVVRRVRDGTEIELTAWAVEGGELRARPRDPESPRESLAQAEVIARIIVAYRVF